MDPFTKPLAAFEKVASHLRHERVLIGFVFFVTVIYAVVSGEHLWVFLLAFVVVIGLLVVRLLRVRSQGVTKAERGEPDIVITAAFKLALLANRKNVPRDVADKLRYEARRLCYSVGRLDLAADIQEQIDEALPPTE